MEVFFAYENGRPMLNVRGKRQMLRPEEINPQKSVLSQRKDPEQYPELTELGRLFGSFRFYRDWEFGIDARAREASPADAPVDFLEESARNLALMVNRLNDGPETKAELLKYMKTFYADAESINTTVVGGRVDVRLQEKSKFNISAARLSDGTLRWMALLTILLHPSPPPLVCLEEPELGLHPDVIRPLAKLLVEASQRMQLVVTTHSDTLVDELTETPEAVIVCEKEAGSTTLRRLKHQELSSWLEQYTLGELWHKGQIGGTRW
jgi:predicted ATPase